MENVELMNCRAVKELFSIDNDLDRFDFLAVKALKAPPFPENEKTDENSIPACETASWCIIENIDGKIRLLCESDSLFVKGLIIVLGEVLEESGVKAYKNGYIGFADECFERGIISVSRREGLFSLEKRITEYLNRI